MFWWTMFWQRYRHFRGFGHSRFVSFLNGALLDAEPYPPKR